jgi:hypothetical protein
MEEAINSDLSKDEFPFIGLVSRHLFDPFDASVRPLHHLSVARRRRWKTLMMGKQLRLLASACLIFVVE